ncbi:MAG: cytochrome c [Gammaproteobacteria bacterium]|nr:cytochrome c [Gammaproteobacteria bacterium]
MTLTKSIIAGALVYCVVSTGFAGDIEAGKQVATTICAACHGADGNSELPANPKLAGQYESYLLQALKDYRSGKRQNPIMSGFAASLSDADVENVAAYFAAQSGVLQVLKR